MKKMDLGQMIAVLANIGVISGIVFLALELNQNNKLLRAEADYNYYLGRTENRQLITTDPDYAEFWARLEANEIATGTDLVRLEAHIEKTILGWQYEYGQIIEGNFIDDLDAARDRWRVGLESGNSFATNFPTVWDSFRSTLRTEFVDFIDTNVLSP